MTIVTIAELRAHRTEADPDYRRRIPSGLNRLKGDE